LFITSFVNLFKEFGVFSGGWHCVIVKLWKQFVVY